MNAGVKRKMNEEPSTVGKKIKVGKDSIQVDFEQNASIGLTNQKLSKH